MKKCLMVLLGLMLMAGVATAQESKETLNAQMQALTWEANYIQQRMLVIQGQAQQIQAKLDVIKQAEDKAAKEKADKKPEVKK